MYPNRIVISLLFILPPSSFPGIGFSVSFYLDEDVPSIGKAEGEDLPHV